MSQPAINCRCGHPRKDHYPDRMCSHRKCDCIEYDDRPSIADEEPWDDSIGNML